MKRYILQSPYQLELMEFRRIEEHLKRIPALLLPVSGPAPLGTVPIGAEMQCSLAIADRLSLEYGIISAPILAFAQSGCFQGFGGCAGMHPSHLETMAGDIIKGWALQGFIHFFVVRSVWPIPEQFSATANRLQNHFPHIECHVLDWRRDSAVRNLIATHCSTARDPRSELSVLQLLDVLGLLEKDSAKALPARKLNADDVLAWKKRGHDPQKLRTFSPEGSLLGRTDPAYTTGWGKELLETILERFGATIRSCGYEKYSSGSQSAKDAHDSG